MTRDKIIETMAKGMEKHSYPNGVSGRMAITIRQCTKAALQALQDAGYVIVQASQQDQGGSSRDQSPSTERVAGQESSVSDEQHTCCNPAEPR